MKLIEQKIIDYVNLVDSKNATPGGGSVAALVSALGNALIGMVAHLTVGKKKFLELDESLQSMFNENFNRVVEIKNELLELVDEDAKSFSLVMESYRLPKNTDEEKAIRDREVEKATINAMDVPIKILDLSIDTLRLIDIFVEHGNMGAMSDVGIGAILLNASVKGAVLNIKINLSSISDKELINSLKLKCEKLVGEGDIIAARVENKMNEYFNI